MSDLPEIAHFALVGCTEGRSSKHEHCDQLETRRETTQVGTSIVSTLAADQRTSSIHWDINFVHDIVLDKVLDGRGDLIGGKGDSVKVRVLEQVVGEVSGEIGSHRQNDRCEQSAPTS